MWHGLQLVDIAELPDSQMKAKFIHLAESQDAKANR
jgi:hypothetical protein